MHFEKQTKVRALLFDKTPTFVMAEYFNYNDIFLAKNVVKLLKYSGIINHTIKLKKCKQLFFRPIYILSII